ncbi:phage tail protein [Adhaeribacter aerolatus]|uniref:Phage tail protein n=1 Tax=Adhaeribacter aerolatus TaxID=670289 RepID=A0A512B3L5_9BACT|nr:phage tail protein [Adhaeribacter aerolatus]GEO06553.1 phage tail protein [Adhaeribacter aerolatus]
MAPSPNSKLHFQVEWQGSILGFSEVTGLAVQASASEYRAGGPNGVSKINKWLRFLIPGFGKPKHITLKRGIFLGSPAAFHKWRQAVDQSARHKADIRISMRNENQELVKVWRLKRARPVKIVAPDLKADGNEVAIESIELTCEGVKIE